MQSLPNEDKRSTTKVENLRPTTEIIDWQAFALDRFCSLPELFLKGIIVRIVSPCQPLHVAYNNQSRRFVVDTRTKSQGANSSPILEVI